MAIPLDDNAIDLIVMDQVLEHVVDLRKAFKEASRVLDRDGVLCISVPDASRYNEKYLFDFYWFLLREHVQHFDIEHLKLLAIQEGFELVTHSQYETKLVSDKMILPVLTVVFRLTGKKREKLIISQDCF